MSVFDLDKLCAGGCMNPFRRKVRAHQHALAVYAADVQAWRIPLMVPEEPAEPRLPYPVYGEPVYCGACCYDIKAKLSKLDGAACVYLRESDGMRGQTDQVRVSGGEEDTSPSPTIEDLDELDGWLRDWRAAYLGTDTLARQGTLADSITLGAAWLIARAERILLRKELAQAFGEEVNDWHRRLARFDPSDVVIKRMKVRCDTCHGLTLEWKQGDDSVRCRMNNCGRVLLLAEYETLEEDTKRTCMAS